jgi:hypothetical protein
MTELLDFSLEIEFEICGGHRRRMWPSVPRLIVG